MSIWISVVAGGALGGAVGYFGKRFPRSLPFAATPWRGAVAGLILGALFHLVPGRPQPGGEEGPGGNVRLVSEAQFEPEVAQAAEPVVVDFFATWCGPCKQLSPMLDGLAGPLASRIKFLKVDVDQAPKLAERFGVEGIPTLVFLNRGKVIDTLVGLPDRAELQQRLSALAGAGQVAAGMH